MKCLFPCLHLCAFHLCDISSSFRNFLWGGGEDGGELGSNLSQTLKLEAAILVPTSFIMQGIGGPCEMREENCLLPFFLDSPVLGKCHSVLALSGPKSTFSWCGMNNLLQFIKFCYLRWLSLWRGLCSLCSPLLFLLCFLCPWYWNLELRILSSGLWARKWNVPSQAHIFLL